MTNGSGDHDPQHDMIVEEHSGGGGGILAVLLLIIVILVLLFVFREQLGIGDKGDTADVSVPSQIGANAN